MGDTPRQEQLDLSTSSRPAEPPASAPGEPVQAGLFPDNSVPDELVGYRGPSACQIAGITYRQLDYWARTSLVVPSIRSAAGSGSQRLYSFKDILVLKVVKRLLDTGVSLQNIRTAVDALRLRAWQGEAVDVTHRDGGAYPLFAFAAGNAAALVDGDVFRTMIRRNYFLDPLSVLDDDIPMQERIVRVFAELRATPRPRPGPTRDDLIEVMRTALAA